MSVGRNDPCPCGSGKKYKKCCLQSETPETNELFWHRVHNMRNVLTGKILTHAKDTYGAVAIEEAWEEFHLWENDTTFDPEYTDMQIFMPWYFFDWHPDEQDSEVNSDAPKDLAPAMSLLRSESDHLNYLERDYIKACCEMGFSFYDILECWPGTGFKVRDILTEESYHVIEKSASKSVKAGSIIFGKPVTMGGMTTLEACSSFAIPPRFKIEILDLKKGLSDTLKSNITQNDLRKFSIDVFDIYHSIKEELFNPKIPEFCNTDGHKIVPNKLTFEIESFDSTLDALAPLALNMTKEEILEESKKSRDGTIKSVDFPWLKLGNKKNKAWENTILGHIKIERNKLIVDVNSSERAKLFENKLKKLMAIGWKLKSKVIEPVEQHLKNASHEKQSLRLKETEDLNNLPEVQAALANMIKSHWDNWIYEKIPALGNKTPLEAAKSAHGREALDALLTDFEHHSEERPMPGQTPEIFENLRKRLGI